MNDLLNAFGLGTGLVLYAMLLAMVVRDRRRGGRLDTVPLATAVLFVVATLVSAKNHVCMTKDCSDIVGAPMIKDNLGKVHHFHEGHQHEEYKEEARLRRIEILRQQQKSI